MRFHWKGGILGGIGVALGWVVAHADPISQLIPPKFAGTFGTVIGLIGVVTTMFSEKVGKAK